MGRFRTFVRFTLVVGLVSYTALVAIMYFAQSALLYPGTHSGAQPVLRELPGVARVSLKAADGVRLAAWFGMAQSGQPTILHLHGNGGLGGLKWRWQRLRAAGVGLLAVAYRGYPGSSGSPSEAGLIEDGRAAYRWLAERIPHADIIVHGTSLGTGVAVAIATEFKPRAVVLEAPYTAVVDVAAERYPLLPVAKLMRDQFISRDQIALIRSPLVIAHGDRDTTIPVAHAERLFALAPAPKRFLRFTGSDHNTLVRDGLYQRVFSELREIVTLRTD
ncbi:MAG: alpha/beta hydrolase [Pseudomonadota bacterium]